MLDADASAHLSVYMPSLLKNCYGVPDVHPFIWWVMVLLLGNGKLGEEEKSKGGEEQGGVYDDDELLLLELDMLSDACILPSS